MKEFDLVEQFLSTRRKEPAPSDVEDLKGFFKERHINNYKIADAIECPPQRISMWFGGQCHTPYKWKVKLESIKQMLIDWEDKHGFIFNSPEHLSTKKCPYDDGETDIKFGRDFNVYDECDTCRIRLDCRNAL